MWNPSYANGHSVCGIISNFQFLWAVGQFENSSSTMKQFHVLSVKAFLFSPHTYMSKKFTQSHFSTDIWQKILQWNSPKHWYYMLKYSVRSAISRKLTYRALQIRWFRFTHTYFYFCSTRLIWRHTFSIHRSKVCTETKVSGYTT